MAGNFQKNFRAPLFTATNRITNRPSSECQTRDPATWRGERPVHALLRRRIVISITRIVGFLSTISKPVSNRTIRSRLVAFASSREIVELTLNIGDILHMSMTPAPSNWPSELWNVNRGTPTSNDNTRNCSMKLAEKKKNKKTDVKNC